jgi:hypothetical protein
MLLIFMTTSLSSFFDSLLSETKLVGLKGSQQNLRKLADRDGKPGYSKQELEDSAAKLEFEEEAAFGLRALSSYFKRFSSDGKVISFEDIQKIRERNANKLILNLSYNSIRGLKGPVQYTNVDLIDSVDSYCAEKDGFSESRLFSSRAQNLPNEVCVEELYIPLVQDPKNTRSYGEEFIDYGNTRAFIRLPNLNRIQAIKATELKDVLEDGQKLLDKAEIKAEFLLFQYSALNLSPIVKVGNEDLPLYLYLTPSDYLTYREAFAGKHLADGLENLNKPIPLIGKLGEYIVGVGLKNSGATTADLKTLTKKLEWLKKTQPNLKQIELSGGVGLHGQLAFKFIFKDGSSKIGSSSFVNDIQNEGLLNLFEESLIKVGLSDKKG